MHPGAALFSSKLSSLLDGLFLLFLLFCSRCVASEVGRLVSIFLSVEYHFCRESRHQFHLALCLLLLLLLRMKLFYFAELLYAYENTFWEVKLVATLRTCA